MKAILILIISIHSFATCYAQQILHPAYYHELTFRGDVVLLNNAPFTGLLIEVGSNKPLGTYRNGYKDGTFVSFYENGKKKNEVNYTRGVKNGAEIWWHVYGQKSKEVYMQNGVPNGTMHEWHSNGMLKTEIKISNGKIIDGDYLTYNEEGKEIERYTIKNSHLQERLSENRKYELFYENGTKQYEVYLNESGKHNGPFTEWCPNGIKKGEGNKVNGDLDGKLTTWSESAFKNLRAIF